MASPSHESLLKFAEDVRAQEAPFHAAAMEAFSSLFALEYRRLRAAQLESGRTNVSLKVDIACNFKSGEITMTSMPEALVPVSRQTSVKISKP